MNHDIFVLFTMDVEPTTSAAGASGPRTDEEGARSIVRYFELLAVAGFTPTYFIHPEVAVAQRDLFLDLRDRGCALGLHLHTAKFTDIRHELELGGLTAAEQYEVLLRAMTIFEDSLGFRPTLFRPGCFSANDATFSVLAELGFTGGSVSIPGRIWPERCCVWSGAYPYVHHANAAFRQRVGDMPFVNVPLSVDLTSPLLNHPVGFQHYPDLRPGGVYADDEPAHRDHQVLLRNILRKMRDDNPPLKTLVIDVHNDREMDGASKAAGHLRTLLDRIGPEIRQLGCRPQNATVGDVVDRFRMMLR